MSNIVATAYRELFLHQRPLIDVRAPVEFHTGSLPGAVNLPLMNDGERAAVGTAYKKSGRDVAIQLGHQLVSGAVKNERIGLWQNYIQQNPDAVIYCFRGGLRSQITQKWLAESGIKAPFIEGGYKAVRNFLMAQTDRLSPQLPMLMISGPTGSAKTHLLKEIAARVPTVDLEELAGHRGSAFGSFNNPQPSQIDFENKLAVELMKTTWRSSLQPLLVEDESRLIGRRAIPESFFVKMRSSDLVYIDESIEQRVENIFKDYILDTPIGRLDREQGAAQFQMYLRSLSQISTKLGGLRTTEIYTDLQNSSSIFLESSSDLDSNKVWIEKLLRYYYDPLYAKSLARRAPKILFKGNYQSVRDAILSGGFFERNP